MTDALALFAPPDAEHAAPELIDLARNVRAAVNTYAHELDRAGARALLDGARALTYLAERAADRAARLPLFTTTEETPTMDDDAPCPCGISHTRAEHGYDPDADDGPDPDDHGPGCDGPYNCTCAPPLTIF